jgi:hypothetical protein
MVDAEYHQDWSKDKRFLENELTLLHQFRRWSVRRAPGRPPWMKRIPGLRRPKLPIQTYSAGVYRLYGEVRARSIDQYPRATIAEVAKVKYRNGMHIIDIILDATSHPIMPDKKIELSLALRWAWRNRREITRNGVDFFFYHHGGISECAKECERLRARRSRKRRRERSGGRRMRRNRSS